MNYESMITGYTTAQYLQSHDNYIHDTQMQLSLFGICRTLMSKRAHSIFFIKATQMRLYAYHLFTPAQQQVGEQIDNYL